MEDNDHSNRETRPRHGVRPMRWLSPTGELRGLDIEQPRPKAARQPGLPAWQRLLERIRRLCGATAPASDWPADRQLVYIIDVPCGVEDRSLVVRVAWRDRRADGQWGRPRIRGAALPPAAALGDEEDQDLLAVLLSACEPVSPATRQGGAFRVPVSLRRRLLERMCRTGRAMVMHEAAEDRCSSLAWDAGGTWRFVMAGEYDASTQCFVLDGVLCRADQRVPVRSAALALEGGVVVFGTLAAALDDGGAPRWLEVFRDHQPLRVPEAQAEQFLRELAVAGPVPPLDLPEQLGVRTVHAAPLPVLRIRAVRDDERRPDRLRAQLLFDYDGATAGPEAGDAPAIFEVMRRRIVVRNIPAEREAAALLLRVGLRHVPAAEAAASEYWFNQRHLVRVVRRLVAEGWRVEALGRLYRAPRSAGFSVSSGIDFFELRGRVDYDGQQADLPAVVSAARRGEGFVRLDDGTMGMVPEEFLRRCEVAAATGAASGDAVRFSSRQLCLLEALVAAGPHTTWDEVAARARDALARIGTPAPRPAPPTFAGTLRPYQCEGMGWMEFLRETGFGGCLADDMGLGKTVQVLALLEARRQARLAGEDVPPSLVVVPSSLVFNWIAEAARFTPQLRILEHTGADRDSRPEALAGWDAVVTTYGIVRRDMAMLRQVEFDYIVLDEAHAIKNPDSDSARAVRLLRGRNRLALSGTPVQNNLGDLWSIFEFLNPGMLGRASALARGLSALRNPDPGTRSILARALRPFILRRTKEQVACELPARLQQTLWCDLDGEQRRLYDELRDHYRRSLLARVHNEGVRACRFQVLEALLRLRQAAIHPGLIDPALATAPSAKLETLLSRIDEVLQEGHKALVFSQFVSMLSIVRSSLEARGAAYEYLDGATRDRAARVHRFQNDPACRLFLISLKAGGLGLNLTAADHVFLLDPWWNPAIEDQAIDRAHRIGQMRTVHACRLISRGTVEEKVIALQESKRQLADAIITADNSMLRMLGREELEMLLS